MIEQVVFYIFATTMVVSALLMLFTKNVLYAAFLIMITLLSIAAIYVFLYADFIAITQIMVYVGGILVLLIFGVMLTNRLSGQAVTSESHNPFLGWTLGGAFFVMMLYVIHSGSFTSLQWIAASALQKSPAIGSTIGTLGIKFMSDTVLPFEVSAILLLIALIGSALIARKQLKS